MNTKDRITVKSYDHLKNNHCLNRWVKYFYECELYKKMLKSHRLDPKRDRYVLDDLQDQALYEAKRKILYTQYIEGLVFDYSAKKSQKMKAKVSKLNLRMLRAMYLLTQNKKIYRYGHRFKNHSGFKKEVYDVDTIDDIQSF